MTRVEQTRKLSWSLGVASASMVASVTLAICSCIGSGGTWSWSRSASSYSSWCVRMTKLSVILCLYGRICTVLRSRRSTLTRNGVQTRRRLTVTSMKLVELTVEQTSNCQIWLMSLIDVVVLVLLLNLQVLQLLVWRRTQRNSHLSRRLTMPPTSPRRSTYRSLLKEGTESTQTVPRPSVHQASHTRATTTHEPLDGVGGLGNGPPACKAFLRKMHCARGKQVHDIRNRSHHWVQEGRIEITLQGQSQRRRGVSQVLKDLPRSSVNTSTRNMAGLDRPTTIVGRHGVLQAIECPEALQCHSHVQHCAQQYTLHDVGRALSCPTRTGRKGNHDRNR